MYIWRVWRVTHTHTHSLVCNRHTHLYLFINLVTVEIISVELHKIKSISIKTAFSDVQFKNLLHKFHINIAKKTNGKIRHQQTMIRILSKTPFEYRMTSHQTRKKHKIAKNIELFSSLFAPSFKLINPNKL